MERVPFNRPYVTGLEFDHIREAIGNAHLSGNGPFAWRCADWLERELQSSRALLTHSCTGALEMAIILADVGPGDEVIMPSFTFVSTANAVVLRGGVPIFVDIRPDTLNLDETKIEAAVTPRTKVLLPVHYAGVACDMRSLLEIADAHGLLIVEDAAQSICATYQSKPLGSFGVMAALSFHETKNVHCGEGGALLVNDPSIVERAEIVQEKGTNRRAFFRGQVDKYSWVDVGSSYLLSDVNAAFLWAQLEHADEITAMRRDAWNAYNDAFEELEAAERLRRPIIPEGCEHNAHMYYVLVRDEPERRHFIERMHEWDVHPMFHYVPLHSSHAGRHFGRAAGDLLVTTDISDRLVRLPLWAGMEPATVERVIEAVWHCLSIEPSRARR
jgi:dTDP-4-amino-4,6-dideoxygalactose transaminase